MRIQHNIMAMNAYRNYSNNTSALSKNLEKLSSGYKINRTAPRVMESSLEASTATSARPPATRVSWTTTLSPIVRYSSGSKVSFSMIVS